MICSLSDIIGVKLRLCSGSGVEIVELLCAFISDTKCVVRWCDLNQESGKKVVCFGVLNQVVGKVVLNNGIILLNHINVLKIGVC